MSPSVQCLDNYENLFQFLYIKKLKESTHKGVNLFFVRFNEQFTSFFFYFDVIFKQHKTVFGFCECPWFWPFWASLPLLSPYCQLVCTLSFYLLYFLFQCCASCIYCIWFYPPNLVHEKKSFLQLIHWNWHTLTYFYIYR